MEPYDDNNLRARLTRELLGFDTQMAMAKKLGIAKNTWNGFEKGNRPITLDVARKLKKKCLLPLDWSLDGDPTTLSVKHQRKLRTLTPQVA